MEKMKNLCIIQARMGSTRLPGKVLLKIKDIPLLEYELKRVKQARGINKIVVATTVDRADNRIKDLCKKLGVDCFRGSNDDVLDRYYRCSLEYPEYNNIVRITGDCPLIDPVLIDGVISLFAKGKYDYVSNVEKETFPDGMDIEIFKKSVLAEATKKASLLSEREHVTLYIRKNKKFKKANFSAPQDWSHFRLTVDEKQDLKVINFLVNSCNMDASYLEYISLLTKNIKIMLKNSHIIRNEGLIKSLKEDFIK